MDIRVITYAYNEIKMLPLKKAWCDHHGLTMVYFDNESTDGSREWAIENGVFEADIITDGAFDISHIMNEVEEYRRKNTYDWTLLAGVDLFLSGMGETTIHDYIHSHVHHDMITIADGIQCNYAMICRNDGMASIDFRKYNQYLNTRADMLLLAKGHRKLSVDDIECDAIQRHPNLWWFNFGHTKSKAERMETFERRKLAWERGLNKGYGSHYNALAQYSFELPKLVTKNIHTTKGGKAYDELCDLLDNLVY